MTHSARKRTPKADQPPDQPADQRLDTPVDQPLDQPTIDDAIDAAKASLGGQGARVQINRMNDQTGRADYITTVDADQMSSEFMQHEFGGGRYAIRFRHANGEWAGRFIIAVDRRVPAKLPEWVLNPEGKPSKPAAPGTAIVPASGSSSRDSMIDAQLLEMMKESQAMRDRSTKAQDAMFASFGAAVTQMMNSTAALVQSINKPAASGQTKELLELMGMLEKIRPTPPPAAPFDQNTAIEKALNLLKRFRDESDGFEFNPDRDREPAEPRGGGVLEKVAEILLPLLTGALTTEAAEKRRAIAPAPAAAATPPAAPRGGGPGSPVVPAVAAPPVQPPPAAEPERMDPRIEMALTTLLERAEEGDDPFDCATDIYNMTPRLFRGQLREFVMRENVVQELLTAVVEFQKYPTFLADVVRGLREEFEPPPADGASPPADVSRN